MARSPGLKLLLAKLMAAAFTIPLPVAQAPASDREAKNQLTQQPIITG